MFESHLETLIQVVSLYDLHGTHRMLVSWMSHKITYPHQVVKIPTRAQVRSIWAKMLQKTDVTRN